MAKNNEIGATLQFRNTIKAIALFACIALLVCLFLSDVRFTTTQAEHERNLRAKEADLIRKMSQPNGDSNRAEVTVQKQTTDVKAGGK